MSDKLSKVTVELKNNLEITGSIMTVDSNLNIALTNITLSDPENFPQLLTSKTCFIRGNVIRYIHFNKNDIDVELVEEACRKEGEQKKLESGK
jgi:U6 snRNA-associated Sm-like protein LSm2